MAADTGGTLSAMASDAASGFSIGGPTGAGVGALFGLLSGLASESSPEYRVLEQRKQLLRQLIAARRAEAIAEGSKIIAQQTQGAVQAAETGAARRAASRGIQDTSGYIQPAGQNALSQGSTAMERFITNTNAQYDQAEMNLESESLKFPTPEPLSNVVAKIGQSATGFIQDIRKQKLIDEYNANQPGGSNYLANPGAPSVDAQGNPTYYPGNTSQADITQPGAVNAMPFADNIVAARRSAVNSFKDGVGPGIAVPGFNDKQVDAATRELLNAHRRMYMGLGGQY